MGPRLTGYDPPRTRDGAQVRCRRTTTRKKKTAGIHVSTNGRANKTNVEKKNIRHRTASSCRRRRGSSSTQYKKYVYAHIHELSGPYLVPFISVPPPPFFTVRLSRTRSYLFFPLSSAPVPSYLPSAGEINQYVLAFRANSMRIDHVRTIKHVPRSVCRPLAAAGPLPPLPPPRVAMRKSLDKTGPAAPRHVLFPMPRRFPPQSPDACHVHIVYPRHVILYAYVRTDEHLGVLSNQSAVTTTTGRNF